MKRFLFETLLCAAVAGIGLAATWGDHGSKTQAKDDCPATALIGKWEKAAAQIASLPAEKRETVARAHATLAASCPVCKEAPASFAFLGKFLGSTVALDGLAIAAHEENSKAQPEIPADIRGAFEERVAIGAKSNELFAAFGRAMAPAGKADCAGAEGHAAAAEPAGELTPAEAGKTFESISEQASRLAETWHLIPARAAALPEGTKTELFAAMEVLKRELPTCELAHETMAVLAGGFERLVSLDQTLGRYCDQYTREHAGELPPEHAQMRKAFQARARATAKVAELIGVMQKTMTPEIFKAPAPGTTGRATY